MSARAPRVAVLTLGCKANLFDSAVLRDRLRRCGYRLVDGAEDADAVVINSCTVTQRSDFQARQLARRCKRRNPEVRVLLAGCYAQTQPAACAAAEGVDGVAGLAARPRLPELVGALLAGEKIAPSAAPPEPDFGDAVPAFDRARPYLKIQEGCDDRCTYCAVPDARGPSRSEPPDEVLARIGALAERGAREVVLSGVHLGAYGRDLTPPTSLAELLAAIGEGVPDALRLRLSSIEPQEVDAELRDALAAGAPWLCRHLHLPVQSGDDAVLRAMGRPYAAAALRQLGAALREIWPGAALGADVIVGFPGEDDAAFARTEALLRELPLAYLHVFPFSPRPGTPAATMPGRPPQRIATDRARHLRDLDRELRQRFRQRALGQEHDVLVERRADPDGSELRGTSEHYLPVRFPGPPELIGARVRVRAETLAPDGTLHGVRTD